jgi:hypothetical protein
VKFVARRTELEQLSQVWKLSQSHFFFFRLTGRRRIGKTELIRYFVHQEIDRQKINIPVLYFYVTRQSPRSLLTEFQLILGQTFAEYQAVTFTSLDQFFQTLLDLHTKHPLITIFDEFQYFQEVDPSAFSILQKAMDMRSGRMTGLFIVIGSLQSMMTKLFDDSKQPLFGRLNGTLHLSPFTPSAVVQLLLEKRVPKHRILDYYSIFGGIPHYYRLVDDYQLWDQSVFTIISHLILRTDGILSNEGLELLLGEFGRNYSSWFSILKAIAGGYSRISEIINHSGVPRQNINRYLGELIQKHQLVIRKLPLGSSSSSKQSRYYLNDQFLNFWFRYVWRFKSWIEFGALPQLEQHIRQDFNTYKGKMFEDFIKRTLIERNQSTLSFTEIGSWWDRGKNEIDLIMVDQKRKRIVFIECKLHEQRYVEADLKAKAAVFLKANPRYLHYRREYRLFAADTYDYTALL